MSESHKGKLTVNRILSVSLLLLVSLLFFNTPGTDDMAWFAYWVENAETHGLVAGYAADTDVHPPGLHHILYAFSALGKSLGLSQAQGLKISMYLFLLLTSLCVGAVTKSFEAGLWSFAIFMLNSVSFVYTDVYFAPFLVLSLYFILKKRSIPAVVMFCVSVLIKAQVIVLLPFVMFQLLADNYEGRWTSHTARRMAAIVVPPLVIFSVIFLVYGSAYISTFVTAYERPIFSGQALNLSWIATFTLRVAMPEVYGGLEQGEIHYYLGKTVLHVIFTSIFILSYAVVFGAYALSKDKSAIRFLRFVTAAFLTYFMLNKGVHENHLFIGVLLLILLSAEDPIWRFERNVWGILFNVNMIVFYGIDGATDGFRRYVTLGSLDLTLPLAVFSLVLYFFTVHRLLFRERRACS